MLDAAGKEDARTWWKRVLSGPTSEDRTILYEDLRALTAAGIGVHEALDAVLGRSRGKRRTALEPVVGKVHAGAHPGEAMRAHPELFPPIECALVRAAERTGRYDRAFDEAKRHAEHTQALTQAAWRQLAYPILLIHVGLLLPLPLVIAMSPGTKWATAFLGSAAVLVALWIVALSLVTLHVGRVRDPGWGRRVAHFPLVGNAFRSAAAARFCAAAAALYDAGVGLPESIEGAAEVSGNGWLRAEAATAANAIRGGATAADSLARVEALPDEAAGMLATGESSGELGSTFARLAILEQDRAGAAVRRSLRTIYSIVFVLVAIGVAVMAYLTMVKPMTDALNIR